MARKLNIERFVHISTDEVYGDMPPGGFRRRELRLCSRAAPIPPRRPARICWCAPTFAPMDFPALITRSSNNYGPYQFPEKFLPLMITNALDDKPLPIYGDGKQQRDWLHVEDNCRGRSRGTRARAHRRGLQYRRRRHVEENLTMARRLLRVMGKPETLLSYVKDRPGHDRRYALNCDKMESELGWKPAISLEEGLRQTIDWYKRNTEWMAGVRGGEYRSYYEKYYENRDSSLHAHRAGGPKSSH